MGYIKHHAIVVTSWDINRLYKAWKAAQSFECTVSQMVGPLVNGYCTFVVVPDGSKEGWPPSDQGDTRRKEFMDWLRENKDGNWWEWVEVEYGSDDGEAKITHTAWSIEQ